jgi:TP901 family phage tail tape measure protein
MEAAGTKGRIAWERVGLGMQNVGRTMTQFVTIPVAAGFAVATIAGYKYEKTLLQIKNLTGLTAAETQNYGEKIKALAPLVGIGPQALAESFYFIASSGYDAAGAMDVLNVSAKASVAGMGDVQVTADVVTSAMNAYGHENLSAARAVDILMKTIEVGKAESEALTRSLGRIMPVAASLGVSLGEVGGAIAGLTLTGLSSAEAVTALRGTMMALVAPAKMSIEEMKRVGTSYQEVGTMIRERGLLTALEFLREKTDGNMLSLRKIIPNVRALNGVLSLLGPNYKKNVEITQQVIDSQGKLNEAFAHTSEQGVMRMDRAIASLKTSFTDIGQTILPTVASAIERLAGAFKGLDNMSSTSKGMVLWGAAFVAAMGPVTMVAGSVIRSIQLIHGALSALTLAGLASFGWVAAAVAAFAVLTVTFSKLDAASTGSAKATKLMAQAAEDADKSVKLQRWADKALGGHYTAKTGKVTWEPAVEMDTKGAAAAAAKGIRQIEAEKRAAIRAESRETMMVQAQARQAELAQMIRLQKESLMGMSGPGGQPKAKTDPYLKSLEEQYARITGRVRELQGVTSKGIDIDKGKVANATLKDMDANIAKLQAKIEKRTKLNLSTVEARRDLEAAKKARDELARETRTVRIKADIADLKGKLKDVRGDLKWLATQKPTPQVKLDTVAARAKEKEIVAALRALGHVVATPTVETKDNATGPAAAIRSTLLDIFSESITQSINIQTTKTTTTKRIPERADGGVFDKPELALIAEDGPEAIIPLSKPARAMQVMAEAGLLGSAKRATTSAANIAKTVASSIAKSISGVGKKGGNDEKLKAAAEVSSSISTLVEFVNGIAISLETLERTTVPKLSAGWQAKIRSIIAKAAKVAVLIAAEINKAFPPGKSKSKTNSVESADTKAGKAGTKLAGAAETSGPIGTLIDFIVGIGESMNTLTTMTFPTISADVKAKVRTITAAAADLSKVISAEIKKAFPKNISSSMTDTSSSASQLVSDVAGLITTFADLTVESVDKAIIGINAAKAKTPELSAAVVEMVTGFRSAMALKFGNDEASSGDTATGVAGNIAGILGNFAGLTIDSIDKAIKGMTEAARRAPELAAATVAMVQAIQVAFTSLFADDKSRETFANASAAVNQITGDVTGIINNLMTMTSKAIQDGIWGAGWVAYKAEELAKSLKTMLYYLATALSSIDATSLVDLSDVLAKLREIADSIAGIVSSLASLTPDQISAATSGGSSLGQNFYNGLAMWHSRIVTKAQQIAADTANALGAAGAAGGAGIGAAAVPAMAYAPSITQTQNVYVTQEYAISVQALDPNEGVVRLVLDQALPVIARAATEMYRKVPR